MTSIFGQTESEIEREKWLEEGDKELTQEELEEELEFYQHLLGLCDYGIQVIKEDRGETKFKNARFAVIKANCERVLLHELLHVLLSKRDWIKRDHLEFDEHDIALEEVWSERTERIIFQLTNSILQLRYK